MLRLDWNLVGPNLEHPDLGIEKRRPWRVASSIVVPVGSVVVAAVRMIVATAIVAVGINVAIATSTATIASVFASILVGVASTPGTSLSTDARNKSSGLSDAGMLGLLDLLEKKMRLGLNECRKWLL